MKISSSSIAILVISMAGASVDAASCSVPTIKTEADCVSFCQSDETSYFNGEAMVICQCIGTAGGLYSTYGDECTCPNTLDTCDGAGGESSTNGDGGSGSLPTWCYDIPENAVPMFPSASSMGIPPGAPTWTMLPTFLCVVVPLLLPARAAPAIFRTPTAPSQLGATISLNQDVRTFPSVLPVANIPLGAATSATPRGSLLVGVLA